MLLVLIVAAFELFGHVSKMIYNISDQGENTLKIPRRIVKKFLPNEHGSGDRFSFFSELNVYYLSMIYFRLKLRQ